MKKMTQEERKLRVLARGELTDHCHVVIGDVELKEDVIVVNEDSDAILRHVLETQWMKGKEVWTGEHKDIKLEPGTYQKIQQHVFDPLTGRINKGND